MSDTFIDECWTCGTEIDTSKSLFVEIELRHPKLVKDSRSVLHRSCMKCAMSLPGVNIDNINAILNPEG